MLACGSEDLTVSVIVIVKNGAKFIAQALASIGLSRQQPIEILVVDGGSSDNTIQIARGVPGVSIIRQQSSGIPGAYNEGIAAARGAILAFLSSDDLWLPGKLDRQLEVFAADPELLISVSLIEHFLQPGCPLPVGFRPELLSQPRPGMLMEALLVRRAAFDIIGPFDPKYSTAEDTDWFARATDAGVKIAVLSEVLVRKRVHTGNASLTDPAGHQNRLRALHASIIRKRDQSREAGQSLV